MYKYWECPCCTASATLQNRWYVNSNMKISMYFTFCITISRWCQMQYRMLSILCYASSFHPLSLSLLKQWLYFHSKVLILAVKFNKVLFISSIFFYPCSFSISFFASWFVLRFSWYLNGMKEAGSVHDYLCKKQRISLIAK